MKVRELIEQLQECDPEAHVETAGGPAWFVATLPAYYDGSHVQLVTDPNTKFYNVLGFKITDEGSKVVIYPHDIQDAMLDNPEIPIDLSGLIGPRRSSAEKHIDALREKYREMNQEE